MSKLGIVGTTALSLALVVASPAFAGGGGAMDGGIGGFRDAQASTGTVSASAAGASYCRQRWAYYDPASAKYMGDDGEWRPCVNRRGLRRRSVS
jgi:hypothetical protein